MLTLALADLPADFRARALQWAAQFAHCAYYEHNGLQASAASTFSRLLAVAATPTATSSLPDLPAYLASPAALPHCGFVTYDVKNEIEALSSHNFSGLDWPLLHFFQPETCLRWHTDTLTIEGQTAGVLAAILATEVASPSPATVPPLRARMPRAAYLQAVENVREDILNGEVYELNLCQEFYAEAVKLDPVATFWRLNETSPAPYAGFLRHHDHYLLCASPESFIRKEQHTITSQPIKGTRRRGTTPADDEQQRLALLHDEKERAENLMIVDLVRNDLARVARTGTVRVPELFGTYGFQHVWQLISTVSAELRPNVGLANILRAAFPMGSMTGAPKIRAMQLIEHYEASRRGLYSGSLGYVLPGGDFAFNVVIRSLQYRADTGYLSLQVGSAITYDSVPEQEYQECLLKAQGVLEALRTVITA
ncbi:anthranilate synthase component I family protein [Hymenobacter ginsengisoli]|uniref:Anthranilate synthase component I family protein n=1 Tax=Hymenobacter ginsengisoli TaxID=1051626 RepID=A0ABP8Q6L2_9BACT|nr:MULTISPECIES: aminodeoxychorismate synthase component I [unclassified Hymenobacter]MBO2030945.1 aminodeoxychorismate synthase component I [Hymenobacter sp. BT559]